MTASVARASLPVDVETWLSVQDASAMLGVSPATLRRWSAAGEVAAFTTPGGHRRYALSTVRALLPHSGDAPVRLSALGESPERLIRVIRRHARDAARENQWVRGLTSAQRDELRAQSRGLVEGFVAHLNARSAGERAAAIAPAETCAATIGRAAAAGGGSLDETLGVFLRFRSLIVAELGALAVRRGLPTSDATALVVRGGEAVDRLLAAMVAGHSPSHG